MRGEKLNKKILKLNNVPNRFYGTTQFSIQRKNFKITEKTDRCLGNEGLQENQR